MSSGGRDRYRLGTVARGLVHTEQTGGRPCTAWKRRRIRGRPPATGPNWLRGYFACSFAEYLFRSVSSLAAAFGARTPLVTMFRFSSFLP